MAAGPEPMTITMDQRLLAQRTSSLATDANVPVQGKERLLREEVTEDEIAEIVSRWTGIPVTRLVEGEREKLLKLDSILHERVVGQDEAVTYVADAVIRARAGIHDPKRPIGSFIFLGPTGVGKTELAKVLAKYLFDSEDALIRIDMSEYMEKFSVSRLIGAPPGYVGYEEGGQLTEKVRRKPYSVVLLDEIEKAHPDVFNILLQVLDDGQLTDSLGRKVDFKNTILIMTSNIGARDIKASKGFGFGDEAVGDKYKHMKNMIDEAVKRVFNPEFLNRIDDTIVFHQLNKEDITKIIDIQVKELFKRMSSMNISIELSKQAKEFLAEKGYDQLYGARPLRRALQKYVEDPVAEEILKGTFSEGSFIKVKLNKKKDELLFTSGSHADDESEAPEEMKQEDVA